MTVRVEQAFVIPAPPEDVWAFISDPGNRADAISVVKDYELHNGEGRHATWHLDLPLRVISKAFDVETEETERRDGEFVTFTGRSSAMRVRGVHRLEAVDGGTRLTNRFVVDGRIPGVERFFERNLPDEIANLEAALRRDLGLTDDEGGEVA